MSKPDAETQTFVDQLGQELAGLRETAGLLTQATENAWLWKRLYEDAQRRLDHYTEDVDNAYRKGVRDERRGLNRVAGVVTSGLITPAGVAHLPHPDDQATPTEGGDHG